MKSKSVLISFCILLSISNNGVRSSELREKPVYKCKLTGTTCIFSNIVLDSTNYEWKPTSDDPTLVREISFISCNIPVVTKDICETFPFLKNLKVVEQGVHEIQAEALHACQELNLLDLNSNQIDKIHPNTFRTTKKLERLNLSLNKIKNLDDHNLLLNLLDLETLQLGFNSLIEFSPELIRTNNRLTQLHLHSNDLSDINAERIVNFLPNLTRFLLNSNEISCTRVVQINEFLQSKGISNDWNHENHQTVRYYPQETVLDSVKCNPDISWMASTYRKEHSKMDQRLDRLEGFVEEKLLKMDQRFDKLEAEMKKLVGLVSQLKNFLM